MFTAAEPKPPKGRGFPTVHLPSPSPHLPKVASPTLPTTVTATGHPAALSPRSAAVPWRGPSQPPTSSVNTSNTPHISVTVSTPVCPPCQSPAGQHKVRPHCTWNLQRLAPHSPSGKASLLPVASRPSVTGRSPGQRLSSHGQYPSAASGPCTGRFFSTRPVPALMPSSDPPLLTQLCSLAIQSTHCACLRSSAPGRT